MKKLLCLMIALLLLSGCAKTPEREEAGALVPKPMALNDVTQNPYMASSENAVHNDSYSSDVSNAVLPLGISGTVKLSLETKNPLAPSAAFYDEYGAMVTPFNGGVAIADMTGEEITRSGVFVPAIHDTGNYRVQISYSFVDSDNNIVLPTTHGHVIVLKTRDGEGNILPVFEKILDVNVSEAAKKVLGDDIDTRLLSIVYDYSGNLWFVTGGFRIVPTRDPAGFMGYLSREYIDKTMAGETVSAEDYLHFYRLTQGESAENGISSAEYGAVILTNKSCYLLSAEDGVKVQWKVDYQSNGTNDAVAGSEYTGGGLAYGGGSTPTLTKELVLFTDNLDPVNLIAVDAKTGNVVAQTPVLDKLPEGTPVSVENSILVYSGSADRVSVVVCNWFGAGNAGLSDPNADSAIQSYDNLYDANWMGKGNRYIAPGMERIDVVKTTDGYRTEKVWFRDDVRDTSMVKLSTATGYIYGYWQNMDTGMWCYEILDFESGETVYELPVSSIPGYNNVAVGMINDVRGNALYCPTNNMEMVCFSDDFVYLPDCPAKAISTHDMERYYVTAEQFASRSGTSYMPKSYLMKASAANLTAPTTIAFRLNGLSQKASDYRLFVEKSDGTLAQYTGEWYLCDENGKAIDADTVLKENQIVQIRLSLADGESTDLDPAKNNVKISVILAIK